MLLKDCLPYLIHQFKSERDLIHAVEELSQNFTTKRESISEYLSDPRLTSAYTAFYLTTNIPKLEAVFKWLPVKWLEELKKCLLVDVGSGPGTFSLAWKKWVGEDFVGVQQIETSTLMRHQAQRLWEGLYPHNKLRQLSSPQEAPGSFLLFGHSANEMGHKEALRYIEKVNPDHILFIEPGTKSFFPEMLKIRQGLFERDFHVLFPCPSENSCPMSDSPADWCHQFIHVRQNPDVERLSQMMKMDRKLLPLTVHAYSRTFNHKDKERIIRVFPSTKFSFEWDVCLGENLDHYQIMKKSFDKKIQKELDEVLAGDSIESELDKKMEQASRVKLIKRNNQIL
jgi:ribosomal protein RSM22 (predicted rRNA methylase)